MVAQSRTILVILSDIGDLWPKALKLALEEVGKVRWTSVSETVSQLRHEQYDIVILDENRALHDDLISVILNIQPTTRIIVVTDTPDWRRARLCFQYGAADYIATTISAQEFTHSVQEI